MSGSPEKWIRTDECLDVLSSLMEVERALRATQDDKTSWKWVILAVHNALQGAMVCHLSGTAQNGARSAKWFKAVMEWDERDRRGEIERSIDNSATQEAGYPVYRIKMEKDKFPNGKLANLMELFKRLQDEDARYEGAVGQVIKVSKETAAGVKSINGFRNEFSHFRPQGWSIEISGLPDTLLRVLSLIETIFNDPWPFRHMEHDDKKKFGHTVESIRARLEAF